MRSYPALASEPLRRSPNWLMSAPDANASVPAPLSTMTRTWGSASTSAAAAVSPTHISELMALRRSGWSSQIVPIESSTVTFTCPLTAPTVAAPPGDDPIRPPRAATLAGIVSLPPRRAPRP